MSSNAHLAMSTKAKEPEKFFAREFAAGYIHELCDSYAVI
jgi:hypothetical protein